MAGNEGPANEVDREVRELDKQVNDFSIAEGGPFAELQKRIGLLDDVSKRAPRRLIIVIGIAFVVPLVLAIAEGNALAPQAGKSFLLDPGVWARFVISIAVFFMMERMIQERLRLHLRQFVQTPLLARSAFPLVAEALTRALRRCVATPPEIICLVLAYAITIGGMLTLQSDAADGWLVHADEAGGRLTVAGWWTALISSPIFWFLLFRWLWRHFVWALLLIDIAKLDLRLVVTHPDGVGGLAFIGQYPNAFTALVLATSFTLAAAMANAFQHDALELTAYGYMMGVWLIVVMSTFALPLTAFMRPLAALKHSAMLKASAGATRHFRAAERAALGENVVASKDSDTSVAADHPNTSATYQAAKKMGTLPFSREALIPLAAAAIFPLVLAGSTQLPFAELWKIAKRLLLL